jgi:hypothetical protein
MDNFNKEYAMLKKSLTVAVATFIALGLTACDVKKTAEGDVSLPKYDVQKTKDGSAKLPQYDVKTPDVAVNTEEKKVEVPTIKKEERTIQVPNVDVTPAKDK